MRKWLVRDLFGATRSERVGVQFLNNEGGPLKESSDVQVNEQLYYFLWMPEMLANIESYFALTIVGMAENLLSLLLLPLKCLMAVSYIERRDVVALTLIAVGMLTYYSLSLYATQLYASLYHVVRRTSFIKLMMVFNILDVADRLLSAISQEVIEVLTLSVNSRNGTFLRFSWTNTKLARSLWVLLASAALSVVCVAAHAVTLLLSVITLNVAVNAEGHLFLALIVSTNLSEMKGVAYKKHNRESLMQLTAADAVERLKFLLFVLIMVMQHMHNRFGVINIADMLLVLLTEVFVDFIKHFFVAKLNSISPNVYGCYLQLTLIDMAAETVLWQIDRIKICCIDDPHVQSRDLRTLLLPSAGFFPNYVRRTGFIPVPYAALLLWSLCPVFGMLLCSSPLLLLLFITAVVLLKLLLSGLIRGAAMRFVVRSLLVAGRGKHSGGNGVLQQAQGLDTEINSVGSVVTLRLSSFLCSLLKLEPFDLQAGKQKR